MAEKYDELVAVEKEKVDMGKVVMVNPFRIKFAINPRDITELHFRALIPSIIAEHGVITEPVMLWKPCESDLKGLTFHDPFTGNQNVSLEEVYEQLAADGLKPDDLLVAIRGHRRSAAVQFIGKNTDDYSGTVVQNAAKIQAMIYQVSERRARDLAFDDEAKKTLPAWNTLTVVFERMSRDEKWQEIALDIPETLYRLFLSRKKYNEYESDVAIMTDGRARNAIILSQKGLRNVMDSDFKTAHLIGPAVVNQRVLYQRKLDGRKHDGLLIDCKMDNMRKKLRQPYTNKEKGDWSGPVTGLYVTDGAAPKGDNISTLDAGHGETFVVVGGNDTIRNALLGLMKDYRNPETSSDTKVTKPPKSKEREEILESSRSDIGRAYALWANGEDSTVNDKSRSELDTWAIGWQEREAILREMDTPEPLKTAISTLLESRNAESITDAFANVVKALEAKNGPSRKAVAARK